MDQIDNDIQTILDYMREYRDLMKQTLDRQDALEDFVYKQILEPARQLNDEYERGLRHDDFVGKHGEALGAFNEKLKAIEGDDFDLVEKTFDDYDKSDKSIGEDEYVAALIAKVQDQLDKISKAFGGGNLEVETKDEDGDGKSEEMTVETDTDGNGEGDKTVAAAVDEKETEDATGEEPEKAVEENAEKIESEENAEEEIIDDEAYEAEMDTPEEIEALKKELEEELARENARNR